MRRRLLLIAYRFDPDFSMESRLAWRRAETAATEFDVTVLCALSGDPAVLQVPAGCEVLQIPHDRREQALSALPTGGQWANARWQRRAYAVAAEADRTRPFDLVHHVSYCGYRQPSECWRLGKPYLWGPVGGVHNFPWRFLTAIEPLGAVREIGRNLLNALQLRHSRRVSRASSAATMTLAANRQAAKELRRAGRPIAGVMLETGIDAVRPTPRVPRDPDQPLRILWAGRACSWKGLPLLLRALAAARTEASFTLRVMSAGPQLAQWRRLTQRLGLDDCVEWVGWPGYEGRQPHYDWADVFAFTSLRDTSGTGLLESLAAGAPIIGFDHQGAADVLAEDCALRIPVTTPRKAVANFREGVIALAQDAERLARLSRGALERARDFLWSDQGARLRMAYAACLDDGAKSAAAQPLHPPYPAKFRATSSPAAGAAG
ncbi:MAG: glycosyltransferase family 4 protein [Pirellulales bacterium]|nr:glycosyltransferase family 4 protein [Pirellulales bacterium]